MHADIVFLVFDGQVRRSAAYLTEQGAKTEDARRTLRSRPRDHLLSPVCAFQQRSNKMASELLPQKHYFPPGQEQKVAFIYFLALAYHSLNTFSFNYRVLSQQMSAILAYH